MTTTAGARRRFRHNGRMFPDLPYPVRAWTTAAATVLTVIVGLAAILGPDAGSFLCGKPASASDEFPSDFCYYVDITITNSGGSTFTNYAVRLDDFQSATLIHNGTFGDKAWDLKPTLGTFQNETDLLVQSLGVNTAGAWFHLPSIGANSTQTIRLYMGNDEQKRDPGLLLTGTGTGGGGNDGASAPYSAAFNIADNLTLAVEVELLDDAAQDGIIAQHWASNTGYSLRLINDAGTLKIRALIDNQACDVAWDSSWTENRDVEMRFANPNVSIWVDGVQQVSCNTGLGSISSATGNPAFQVSPSTGRLENVIVRDIELLSASTVIARWGFDADQTTETVDTNPYELTTVDYSGNGHTLTAVLTRPQTNLSISFGAVLGVTTSSNVTIPTVIPDILGPSQPIITVPGSQQCSNGIWARFWCPAVTGDRIPDVTNWSIVYFGVGLIFAMAVYIKMVKSVPISLAAFCLPITYGVLQGHLPEYYLMTWILVVGFGWLSLRGGEQGGGG